MGRRRSRQRDATWEDGAIFKHGNLFQAMYSDPARDVVGTYSSTCPVNLNAEILMGYIRQVAKSVAGN